MLVSLFVFKFGSIAIGLDVYGKQNNGPPNTAMSSFPMKGDIYNQINSNQNQKAFARID